MTMTRRMPLLALGALALAGIGSLVYASADRPDCPGKIECPITGELVCRDQCPLVDPDRPDCPGKVECPPTEELVCQDRCPLSADAEESAQLASCCRK